MAPTLRPRGYDGRHRSSQTQSEGGISRLSVHSDTEIINSFKDYRKNNHPNVPQNFNSSIQQGERDHSEARSNASGPSRILTSSSSHGSHVYLPEYPNPINPANEAFHHAFEINMKHMEDFTKVCAHAVKKKLNSCLNDFSEISQSHKQFLDKQYSTMDLIRKGVPTIAENLSELCEFMPKMEANLSTQNSRFMSRIENTIEDHSSQSEQILHQVEKLAHNFKDLAKEDTKNKLDSKFKTFEDLSNRFNLNL